MLRTFRIIATDKDTHALKDYKYTESYIINGTTATVSYYDEDFTSLTTETLDLTQYEVRGMPNKTSRLGARYKERPLPSIKSLLPKITFTYRPLQRINVNVPKPAITPPGITYSIKYPAKITISVPAPNIVLPTVTISK